jgi:hypothetical protein
MDNLRHNLLSYLDYHGLDALGALGIRVSSDDRYPGLYNLKYGSIVEDKYDPIVRACRGAVVEEVLNDGDHSPYFRLVAYAFDRFYNLGEYANDTFDWGEVSLYEKYDGSLIKLFNWGGLWIVSTSGSVGGAGEVGSSGKSFEELFWETFDYCDYFKSDLDSDNCYIFELCSQENRIVVNYSEPQLRLLAVRNRRDNFNELPLCDFAESFDVAESFTFGRDELVEAVNARGADHEGFIAVDADGNRLKVKSDVYVQLHRVRGNGEPDFSELYLNGDLDEFLLHFPEYSKEFDALVLKMDLVGWGVECFVQEYSKYSQKEFAAIVLENHPKVSGAMFGIRSGKFANFNEYVAQLKPKQLDALLGLG